MANQSCAELILSEEHSDFIITQERLGPFRNWTKESLCRTKLGLIYDSIHVPNAPFQTVFRLGLDYSMVPACYTLIDVEAMNQAGVAAIQNYP